MKLLIPLLLISSMAVAQAYPKVEPRGYEPPKPPSETELLRRELEAHRTEQRWRYEEEEEARRAARPYYYDPRRTPRCYMVGVSTVCEP